MLRFPSLLHGSIHQHRHKLQTHRRRSFNLLCCVFQVTDTYSNHMGHQELSPHLSTCTSTHAEADSKDGPFGAAVLRVKVHASFNISSPSPRGVLHSHLVNYDFFGIITARGPNVLRDNSLLTKHIPPKPPTAAKLPAMRCPHVNVREPIAFLTFLRNPLARTGGDPSTPSVVSVPPHPTAMTLHLYYPPLPLKHETTTRHATDVVASREKRRHATGAFKHSPGATFARDLGNANKQRPRYPRQTHPVPRKRNRRRI